MDRLEYFIFYEQLEAIFVTSRTDKSITIETTLSDTVDNQRRVYASSIIVDLIEEREESDTQIRYQILLMRDSGRCEGDRRSYCSIAHCHGNGMCRELPVTNQLLCFCEPRFYGKYCEKEIKVTNGQ